MIIRRRLTTQWPTTDVDGLTTDVLLWRTQPATSSFHTQLDPWAVTLGETHPAAVDLLRVAVGVYITDRISPRARAQGDRWTRRFRLDVEVTDVERCNAVRERLEWILEFLTGDEWSLGFTPGAHTPCGDRRTPVTRAGVEGQVVSLFSGGADSTCGVLTAAHDTGVFPVLVSHWDATVTSEAQMNALTAITKLTGTPTGNPGDTDDASGVLWHRIRLGRRRRQIGSGIGFGRESSSRIRSLLFLALGTAVAAQRSGVLWVPENGYLSLNLPLAPERGSTLTTRTTHPLLLHRMQALIDELGIPVTIHNPFTGMTKSEMFTATADRYSPAQVATVLGATHSCAKANMHFDGIANRIHCGLCYACLVRRSAFLAAGWPDPTTYIETSPGPHRDAFVNPPRRVDYETVQAAAARGFTIRDVLTHQLPPGADRHAALDLAQRGLAEVAAVHLR